VIFPKVTRRASLATVAILAVSHAGQQPLSVRNLAEFTNSVNIFFRYYAHIFFRDSVIGLFRDRLKPLLAFSVID
jgi:hypothetical protein